MIELRASAISGYSDCARRAMADALYSRDGKRLGLRDMIGVNISALMGTIIHKLMSGDDNGQGQAKEWLEIELLEGGNEYGGIRYDRTTPTKEIAATQLREMAHRVKGRVKEWNEGSIIERDMVDKLRIGGTEFILGGRLDRIGSDNCIHDLKTGARFRGAMQHAAQLGAYSLLAERAGYISRVKECVITFVPRLADGEMAEGRMGRDECVAMTKVGIKSAIRAWESYNKDGNPDDIEANPRSPLCSELYCRAHGTEFCKISQKKLDN